MKISLANGETEETLLLLKSMILKSKHIKILWDINYVVLKGKECTKWANEE